jgi:uncharacterized membrane protein HdeD (DUF308 family)
MERHNFDVISFVFGTLFVVFGIPWLVTNFELNDVNWNWVWPTALILIGGVMVLSATRRSRSLREADPEG